MFECYSFWFAMNPAVMGCVGFFASLFLHDFSFASFVIEILLKLNHVNAF